MWLRLYSTAHALYAFYALATCSGILKKSLRFTLRTLYDQPLVLRSTSTYRHVNRCIFSRDAGRTKSKPVVSRSRSFMSMCLLWLQRSPTPPGCAGVHKLNTYSRPAKLATHLSHIFACLRSEILARRSLSDPPSCSAMSKN